MNIIIIIILISEQKYKKLHIFLFVFAGIRPDNVVDITGEVIKDLVKVSWSPAGGESPVAAAYAIRWGYMKEEGLRCIYEMHTCALPTCPCVFQCIIRTKVFYATKYYPTSSGILDCPHAECNKT